MADRSNDRLNTKIEDFIRTWNGTAIGQSVKNMYENGCDYESICEVARIDYDDYDEEEKEQPGVLVAR